MTTLTLAEAAQLWAPAQAAAGDTPAVWEAVFDGARAARWTGTILGTDVADLDGHSWHAVHELEAGETTDRYMTGRRDGLG